MELTAAGRALLSRARDALALTAEGFEAARAVAAGRRGRLSVGYMFALAHAVLPKLVPDLRRSLPKVDLEFVELSASTREARLLDHSVTVALCMPAIRHSEIEASTIGTQRLMLASRFAPGALRGNTGEKTAGPPAYQLARARRRSRDLCGDIAAEAASGRYAGCEPGRNGPLGSQHGPGRGRPGDPSCLRRTRMPNRRRVQAVPGCPRCYRCRGLLAPRFSQSAGSEFPEVRGKGDPSGLIVGGLEGLVDKFGYYSIFRCTHRGHVALFFVLRLNGQ